MPFLGHPFRLLFATAQSFALSHVIWAYGVSIGPGWGPSMMPTFFTMNEWFVTDKRYRRGRGVQVGDCVEYHIPVKPGEEGVKRVLGMPGDYVLLNSPPSLRRGVALRPGPEGGPAAAAGSGLGGGEGVGVDRVGRAIGNENMIQVSPLSFPLCALICVFSATRKPNIM
jgi:hypothetical protein